MYETGSGRDATKVRECVKCGWSDQQKFDVPAKEISTRVNQTRVERDNENEMKPVRIIE